MPISTSDLPFSPACERNKQPIARVLEARLSASARVLEIGSGTGQHAVYFIERMPGLNWQASDVPDNLSSLKARFDLEAPGRLPDPMALELGRQHWPPGPFEAVFTANTLHIMPFDLSPVLFEGAACVLESGGLLLCYGPFMDNGVHTADSNRRFDASLRQQDPTMGIRDTAEIFPMAEAVGLSPQADIPMPANNRVLVFRKGEGSGGLRG
jgi:cyclopropane fatty-acyl-phospholipid synthase-like methyltransferase